MDFFRVLAPNRVAWLTAAHLQINPRMPTMFCAFEGERDELNWWARKRGENGIRTYWKEKNRFSLDGIPTRIAGDET
jgi:hypothetical protein